MPTDPVREPDVLLVDRPVAPAVFVRKLALSPAAFPSLAVGWAALALVGTQLPQADAPWPVTDGLSRPDLLAIHGLGLDRLAGSAAFWLLLSLTIVVAVARLLFPEAVAVWRSARPATDDLAARLLKSLKTACPRVRATTFDGRVRIDVGAPVVGPVLLVAAGIAAAVCLAFFATSSLPVWVDVPVDGAERALHASSPDGGTLGTAAGRWRGRCAPAAGRVQCSLDVPGALPAFTLAPGEATSVAGMRFAWVATGRTTDAGSPTLLWRPTGSQVDYAIRLQAGQMREALALGGARFLDVPTQTAGPLVLLHYGPTQARTGAALVSPALGLPGREVAAVQTTDVVRLQKTEDLPIGLLWIALALAATGAWLSWGVARLRVEVDPQASRGVVVHSCNRLRLLGIVTEAANAATDSVAQVR